MCHKISACVTAALCWLLSCLSTFLPMARCLPRDFLGGELFNRYRVTYTAQTPLRGEITYYAGCRKKTEAFFLEPADEPAEFSCFIDGFLNGVLARRYEGITLRALDGSEGVYSVKSVERERAVPPKDMELSREDASCRFGVSLRWGGALNSFIWKAAPPGFGNLLNRYDEGRLVQQSYYGIGEAPYVAGWYNNSPWGYNPVQGGDQHGNRSKLVDYRVSGNQIYIKCRPMDWSKKNELTPSYMENTYTLEQGVLTVDNRFVDFSGWLHPTRNQEMPAFYVVSALGTFSCYSGSAPWTAAPLVQDSSLPFWGDPANAARCYINFAPGNTETWCAWTTGTQPEAFGVGVYTPEAELLLAGRFGDKVSRDPNDLPTNYVAPLRTLRLQSFRPLEYSYYITAGTLEAMRGAFARIHTENGV